MEELPLVFNVSVSVRRADNLENTWTLNIAANIQVTEILIATRPPNSKMLGIGGVITEKKGIFVAILLIHIIQSSCLVV